MNYEKINRKPHKRGFWYEYKGLFWRLEALGRYYGLTEVQLNARVQALRAHKGNIYTFEQAVKQPVMKRRGNKEVELDGFSDLSGMWKVGPMARTVR